MIGVARGVRLRVLLNMRVLLPSSLWLSLLVLVLLRWPLLLKLSLCVIMLVSGSGRVPVMLRLLACLVLVCMLGWFAFVSLFVSAFVALVLNVPMHVRMFLLTSCECARA